MSSPTAGPGSAGIGAERFEWPLARLARSVHSSFSWCGDAVDPKSCVPLERKWGERHALSLLAQYAAHQAFLSIAGLPDQGLDLSDWLVVRARGLDVRLLRIAGGSRSPESGESPFDRTVQFANLVGVSELDSLDRPWGRPDQIYAEARELLRRGSAADLSSVEAAATGAVIGPEPDELERILGRSSSEIDAETLDALRALAHLSDRELVTIGGEGASPLVRGSALPGSVFDPQATAEELAIDLAREDRIVVVPNPERLDALSRSVVENLRGRQCTVVSVDDGEQAHAFCRPFLVSTSTVAARALLEKLGGLDWSAKLGRLRQFVASNQYDRFLSRGELPLLLTEADGSVEVAEPARSFLAALSLLGSAVELELATLYLARIGALVSPLDLVVPGVVAVRSGQLAFESEAIRSGLERTLPDDTILSLTSAALDVIGKSKPLLRFRLHLRSGSEQDALAIVATALSAGEIAEGEVEIELRSLGLSTERLREFPILALVEARDCFSRGEYRSVLRLVEGSEGDEARLLAARATRRLGRYEDALELLETLDHSFGGRMLRAVLLRLQGEAQEAELELTAAEALASNETELVRLEFERAVLSIDRKRKPKTAWKRTAKILCPWLVERFDTYLEISRQRFSEASESATRAIDLAPDLCEEIDARLDLVYCRFMSGDWSAATMEAREALRIIEETEGDRAGAGALYILGYLSADAGRWDEAERALRKLDEFYSGTRDERRRRELDLIRAQLAMGRLQFTEARRAALRAKECDSAEIRFAAGLVLDELDWIDGSLSSTRSAGDTECSELRRRAMLMRARAGEEIALSGFFAELVSFEKSKGESLPTPVTPAERLILLRSLTVRGRRESTDRFESLVRDLSAEAAIEAEVPRRPLVQDLLMALATIEMPPPPIPIGGLDWRFATQNRLGAWNQYGSLPPLEPDELESSIATGDALGIDERSRLWLDPRDGIEPDEQRAIASLWRLRWEHRNLSRLQEQLSSTVRDDVAVSREGIIGESRALLDALKAVPAAAGSELPVTIEGETGTGKERVARMIHDRSRRRGRVFTPVNCGALPENLVESELFGHVRGAFTGADRDREGLIEMTDGGTLFLDEIGELPLQAQAKLLRFLQEGEFRRVGESRPRHANVRIVAATNRTLEEEVDAGRFRADLYYRVRGFEITLPPLRRRGGDVMMLARHFLREARKGSEEGPNGFTDEVEGYLLGYGWPGNIRELQNIVSGAYSLAGDAPLILPEHLPQRVRSTSAKPSQRGSYYEELTQFRRHLIEQSLLESRGNQSQAARVLGMTRQALSYQIKELGIHVRKR